MTRADRVMYIIKRMGLSQSDLANMVGHGKTWATNIKNAGDNISDKVLAKILFALRIYREDFFLPEEILRDPNIEYPPKKLFLRREYEEDPKLGISRFYQDFLSSLLGTFRQAKSQFAVIEPMGRYEGISTLKEASIYHEANIKYFKSFMELLQEKIAQNPQFQYYRLIQYPHKLDRLYDSPSSINSGVYIPKDIKFQLIVQSIFEENFEHYLECYDRFPKNFHLFFLPQTRNWTSYIIDESSILSLYSKTKSIEDGRVVEVPDMLFVDKVSERPRIKILIREQLDLVDSAKSLSIEAARISKSSFEGFARNYFHRYIQLWEENKKRVSSPSHSSNSTSPSAMAALAPRILQSVKKLKLIFDRNPQIDSPLQFQRFILNGSGSQVLPIDLWDLISNNVLKGIYPNWEARVLIGNKITGKTFEKEDFKLAKAVNQTMDNVSFIDCDLRGMSFQGATLQKVDFSFSRLENVDFTDAELIDCDFAGVTGWYLANYNRTKIRNSLFNSPNGFFDVFEDFFRESSDSSEFPPY